MSWEEDFKLFKGYLKSDAERIKKGNTARSEFQFPKGDIMKNYEDIPDKRACLMKVVIDMYTSYLPHMTTFHLISQLWHQLVLNSTHPAKRDIESEIIKIVLKKAVVVNTFVNVIDSKGLDINWLRDHMWNLPYPLHDIVCVKEAKVPEIVKGFLWRKKTVTRTHTVMLTKTELYNAIAKYLNIP
jgi:hypothetical protein